MENSRRCVTFVDFRLDVGIIIPHFEKSVLISRLGGRMSVKSAHNVLQKFWDGRLPVDPVAIAKAMGVTVVADPLLDHSGHYQRNGGSPRILYNSSEPPVRQRFTVAHEIGHHVNGDVDAPRDTSKQFSSSSWDPVEAAANKFAAALLMPAEHVRYAVFREGVTDLWALARTFGVSSVAMQYRLKNLRLI